MAMMRSPFVTALWAVALGLIVAAGLIVYLKPEDRAIMAPGTLVNLDISESEAVLRDSFEPPRIIVLGAQAPDAPIIHLVAGGDIVKTQKAYQLARDIQMQNPDMAFNIIPAFAEDHVMRQAFTWALRLPKNSTEQAEFLDSVMSINGDVTPQGLMVVAQNMALDMNSPVDQEQQELIDQTLEQSSQALPPQLPALWHKGRWLYDDTLNSQALGLHTGQTVSDYAPHLVLKNAYAYATPPNPKVAATFMEIENRSHEPVKIISAHTPVAGRTELHNHFHEDGAIMMREIPSIDLEPNAQVRLKPEGLHVMLYDLPAPLAVGQTFPISLVTTNGAEISTLVKVTPIGQALTE